jgi:D-glycero-D-manno-heptose 1,7-bisphosphate phosphatase
MVASGASGRAVFLDRDGVLVIPTVRDGRSYAPTSLDGFHIYPDARESLDRLKRAGFRLVVATNQPDVGNGRVRREVVEEMHERMRAALPVDAIKVCYHSRKDACACRKPLPGMLIEAAAELHIEPRESYMVGDRASDVGAGSAAGCRTVFIDRGYTTEPPPTNTDRIVRSLGEAAEWILADREATRPQ